MRQKLRRFFSVVYYNLRTRQKLFIGYLLAVMLPCLLMTALFYYYLHSSVLDTDIRSVHTMSRQAATWLDSAFQQAHSITNSLLLNFDFNEILDSCNRDNNYFQKRGNIIKLSHIKTTLQEYKAVHRTCFYFSDSVIEANRDTLFFLSEIEREGLLQSIVQEPGDQLWTVFANERRIMGGGETLSMLQPLFNPEDMSETIGFIRVDYLQNELKRQIENFLPTARSTGFLVDRSGGILSRGGPCDKDGGLPVPFGGLVEGREPDEPFYTCLDAFGEKTLVCINPVPASGMYLIFLTPFCEIERSDSLLLVLAGVLMVLEALITLCFGGFLCMSLARSSDLQLRLLYSQLNPHFLYNTLDIINWQAISLDVPEIYQPLQALSRLYKLTLNKGSAYISVKDELDHIRLYVQLQNLRFQNGIRLQTDYSPEVLNLRILNMLLQPIVENAIVHGILERPEQSGTITITARLGKNDLVFCVEDDGVGIPPQLLSKIQGSPYQSDGYGMQNIRERIRIAYGRGYGISIQSLPGMGTRVVLTLPAEHGRAKPGE